jgi:hypothetical protein
VGQKVTQLSDEDRAYLDGLRNGFAAISWRANAPSMTRSAANSRLSRQSSKIDGSIRTEIGSCTRLVLVWAMPLPSSSVRPG